jgi:hypothetical protein
MKTIHFIYLVIVVFWIWTLYSDYRGIHQFRNKTVHCENQNGEFFIGKDGQDVCMKQWETIDAGE